MSIKDQGHYLTLTNGRADLRIKTCFSRKLLSFGTKFHMKSYR